MDKIKERQQNIDGIVIARLIADFRNEFRDIYSTDVFNSSLCAVGPLQTMIGLAIEKGYFRDTHESVKSEMSYEDVSNNTIIKIQAQK